MENRFVHALFVAVLVLPGLAVAHGAEDRHGKDKQDRSGAAVEDKPFGREGDPKKVVRTIAIGMSDAMRYDPAVIRVKRGDTVRIVAANHGKVLHEMVIGTPEELKEHAALMRKNPGMEHDEPYMAHVKPGTKESLVWQFDKPGEFHYACLIPGHFEAGMVGRIVVAP